MDNELSLLQTPPLSQGDLRKNTVFSEGFYTLFCNHVRMAVSQTDFRLFIGESFPTATGPLRITENMSIAMTPAQAKSTLKLLTQMVAIYEKQFGTIPEITPPEAKAEKPPEPPSNTV